MNLQIFDYQDTPVTFREDGYLNASAVASRFGKRTENYLRTDRTKAYIEALADVMGVTPKSVTEENQIVIVIQGGEPTEQGTWLHPKLAVDFARWLDARFAVWCDEKIRELLETGHTSIASPTPTAADEARRMRAEAQLINARTRQALAVNKLTERMVPFLSQPAVEALTVTNAERLLGTTIDYRPRTRPLFSATEIGERLGISNQKVGRLANLHNLKTDTYGMTVLTKAAHSEKQVSTFMYYEEVVDVLRTLLDVPQAA